ncbi:hypothetical protein [Halorarius halobius]|uniref:hypothetical protein n=1 Tax=Halorarius halobius TaxID=2962671 RepID=UPI0020CE92A7|nr:hypothetical protein [Halorarius halobius]
MVTLAGEVVGRYERFSLYNSPYSAHDRGRAVDLYPGENGGPAPSPVAGEVLDTRTVRCPPKAYAVDEDHLILVDCGDVVARILHVDPGVEAGDEVAVGESLGTLVRSGFFGQWVDDHLHVGFRDPDQNPYRASGSLPLALGVDVAGVAWDGRGTVVETGPTHALLDAPVSNRAGFVALASDEGVPLDGGLAHYGGGGTLAPHDGPVSLLGTEVGTATGGDVAWHDVGVWANDHRATGLSLFASRVAFGAKLVFHEGHQFEAGDDVRVRIDATGEPIRLG